MSTLGWVWNGVKWLFRQAPRVVGIKPVAKWPDLDTPAHQFREQDDTKFSWYAQRECLKCERYLPNRELITDPPCAGKPPSVIVELS